MSLHVVLIVFSVSYFNYSNSKPSVLLFDNTFFIEKQKDFLENKKKKTVS